MDAQRDAFTRFFSENVSVGVSWRRENVSRSQRGFLLWPQETRARAETSRAGEDLSTCCRAGGRGRPAHSCVLMSGLWVTQWEEGEAPGQNNIRLRVLGKI